MTVATPRGLEATGAPSGWPDAMGPWRNEASRVWTKVSGPLAWMRIFVGWVSFKGSGFSQWMILSSGISK
jgi:hypothetical protein